MQQFGALLEKEGELKHTNSMKPFIFFLLVSIPLFSGAQHWIEIPGTKILFSNFIDSGLHNWYQYQYEYFRKGDQLLMVDKNVATGYAPKGIWGLYDVFRKSPEAFESICREAMPKYDRSDSSIAQFLTKEWLAMIDTNLLNIPFSELVVIENKEEVYGYKERIWILGISGLAEEGPCYFNLVFRKKKPQKGKFTLKFLSAQRSYCEI